MDNFIVKNNYGIPIKICCASCMHNLGMHTEYTRKCGKGGGNVKPSHSCIKWAIKPCLEKAGKGNGMIKKKAYLDFVRDYEHRGLHRTPLEEMQTEFEKEYGSIYYTNI